ncbi:MAG: FHA domain-containing protein [Vicinamibacteria bacterium]
MRFEIRYPTGAQHEVELSGTIAVLGRDPSCDLVLNDPKCSRRHAVLEAGPDGIAVRDAGSANGIYVNGKKVERAQLVVGDTVRLGEVTLKVLEEDVPGTLVMAPEDMPDPDGTKTPFPAPIRAPKPAPKPAPPAPPPGPAAVPAPVKPVPPPAPAAPAPPRPRPEPPRPAPPPPPRVEPRAPAPAAKPGGTGKTLLIVGAVGCLLVLLLVIAGILAAIFLPRYLRSRMTGAVDNVACLARLRAVAAAEDGFSAGTCGSYADLDGLTNPASIIPHYPAAGPVFLGPELASAEANGCRFELTVEEPVTPAEGCPKRSFRRFSYSASPKEGNGRYLLIGSDGIVHFAEGHAATVLDPPLQ